MRGRRVSVSGHDGHSCSVQNEKLLIVCNPTEISVIVGSRRFLKSSLTAVLRRRSSFSPRRAAVGAWIADTAGLTQVRTLWMRPLKDPDSSETPLWASLRHSTFLRTTLQISQENGPAAQEKSV